MKTSNNVSTTILNPQKLAHFISTVHENPEVLAQVLLDSDIPDTKAHTIAVTGSTAAGKSTLIDKIIHELRDDDLTVIVLAIDPTEEESGGALLGDTIRMRDHYSDKGVFLRSFGSRGASAAVTQYLSQVIELASHFADVVLVETAGAGQADTGVKRYVDTFVVLPDTRSDAINLLKAGHHRHADILVVNVRAGSQEDERFFALLQSFAQTLPPKDGWRVPMFRVNAETGEGVGKLAREGLYVHRDFIQTP
ncbi:methylmalonyl Co-A mutase-associated GTPase MeaB [Patescibacteria group bacterium AH-259-L07]|nr:methylmalonyl Co-A mutase-associated GTPase MeaB [Patescibacteria group bacterium AH-259-L07]